MTPGIVNRFIFNQDHPQWLTILPSIVIYWLTPVTNHQKKLLPTHELVMVMTSLHSLPWTFSHHLSSPHAQWPSMPNILNGQFWLPITPEATAQTKQRIAERSAGGDLGPWWSMVIHGGWGSPLLIDMGLRSRNGSPMNHGNSWLRKLTWLIDS